MESAFPAAEIAIGESIAVDGACLTVVEKGDGFFEVDLGKETLARTTAKTWKPGRRVNLERAMRLSDRLGGHMVLGHVDGVGSVEAIEPGKDFTVYRIRAPKEVARYIIPKGSIAVQGISLTVNEIKGDVFSVGIIPHTTAKTNLSDLKIGDEVNLEGDLVGKYVEKFFKAGDQAEGITREWLEKKGFWD
ncbi:MAG: riboflavin synthase [Deltaproteobacteria bacterium]|nr:riboflavin synthase [Deltaproteobacteria bacterium]